MAGRILIPNPPLPHDSREVFGNVQFFRVSQFFEWFTDRAQRICLIATDSMPVVIRLRDAFYSADVDNDFCADAKC